MAIPDGLPDVVVSVAQLKGVNMIDFKLKLNNYNQYDISIHSGGKPEIASDSLLVPQKIYLNLKMFQGEYFYDTDAGLPYYAFLRGDLNQEAFQVFLISLISDIPGVEQILNLNLNIDKNRNVEIVGKIRDEFGRYIALKLN